MKRKLLVLLVMPLVLAAAAIAGVKESSAESSSAACGPGGSGPGGSGVGGSGVGCSCYPYLSVPDRLYGVAETSASNVWAVGVQPSASLIMHWTGCAWSVSFTLPVGYFTGVSARAPGDAWAVGGTNWFSPAHTLAEHWNGLSWTGIATPSPGGNAVFSGVAAISPSSALAVGRIGPGPGIVTLTQPLVERWNGSTWSVQPLQEPSNGGQFNAVAAASAANAWAVGWTGGANGSVAQALIEHSNGGLWTIVPCPHPGTSSYLEGITVISSRDVWAVGFSVSSSGTDVPLTLHWNGITWTQFTTLNPSGNTKLQAVAAAGTNDVWATGITAMSDNGAPRYQGVIMHWDGTRWSPRPHPSQPSTYLNDFLGVTARPGDAWVVGTSDYTSTLIQHWNGTSWR